MGAQDNDARLWGGGIVPYEINPDLGNISGIHDAIRAYERQTNLRFAGRFIQEDYVRFSKQTQGNPNSPVGRQYGGQFLNASGNDTGTLLHEIGHAVGLMHEHQRSDRDQFVIFHADRVGSDIDQYERRAFRIATPTYDFQSLMHYNAGDPSNPAFESQTGTPSPSNIGSRGVLTALDLDILSRMYPSPPVIRRTDGAGGAGEVLQTSAVAFSSVNNTAVVAEAASRFQ
jgi:Astacin (Peptidase family M12A)